MKGNKYLIFLAKSINFDNKNDAVNVSSLDLNDTQSISKIATTQRSTNNISIKNHREVTPDNTLFVES